MRNFFLAIAFFMTAQFGNYYYKDHFLQPATDSVLLNEQFTGGKLHYDWQQPSWQRASWWSWEGAKVYYKDSQILFKEDTLVLTTDTCVSQGVGYPNLKGGEITSTDFMNITYGYAEVCVKPCDPGWSCSWWWESDAPTHRESGTIGYEIDFGEFECDTPDAFTVTIHQWNLDGSNSILGTRRFKARKDLTQNYHVFGCDWQVSYIDFYLDNNLIYHYTGKIPNTNCFLWVSNGYKIGTPPFSAYVKSVRVQQHK